MWHYLEIWSAWRESGGNEFIGVNTHPMQLVSLYEEESWTQDDVQGGSWKQAGSQSGLEVRLACESLGAGRETQRNSRLFLGPQLHARLRSPKLWVSLWHFCYDRLSHHYSSILLFIQAIISAPHGFDGYLWPCVTLLIPAHSYWWKSLDYKLGTAANNTMQQW